MLTKEMQGKVQNLYKDNNFKRLNERFRSIPSVDVAELIRLWPLVDQIQVIEELSIADSATVFFPIPLWRAVYNGNGHGAR